MDSAALIFPHQLFDVHPALSKQPDIVLLIENSLFFYDNRVQFGFHRQKLTFHIASMTAYASRLLKRGLQVERVNWSNGSNELLDVCADLSSRGIKRIVVADLHDDLLQKRLNRAANAHSLLIETVPTPGFINTSEQNQRWRSERKRWHMADFYQWQRKRLNILMTDDKPEGGSWSFDKENRKKIPLKQIGNIPVLATAAAPPEIEKINNRLNKNFQMAWGDSSSAYYPTTHEQANTWLDEFLEMRFAGFGAYEDAIVKDHSWLYHSVLTPMLNTGLLEPTQVINKALDAADEFKVPINSTEGFVRQIIGWREFMRATYEDIGVSMRTTNHWSHTNTMPDSMYDASTGLEPIDNTIERILETGYCHHIERLMVIGGFLFLCEIDPDDIYKWFMELFVDSYDWVMVPNVYAMSQHADGGSITTKPYFSGSNYIVKMSNYKKGNWSEIWDALFWRWIILNKKRLEKNHRWSMMCKNADRMEQEKQKKHLHIAETFLENFLNP